MRNISY